MSGEGRGAAGERAAIAIALGTIALATAYLFAPLVIGAITGEPRFFEWDVPEQYWADLSYLCRSLHAGELPYWNPYDRAGYPYYADPQASAYHPLAWGICAVAGPSPALAWQEARVVIGFAIAGVFGLLWLRRLGASWGAATLGAVLIEAAPFMRQNWELNLTSALAWLPMVLWALERVLQERRARDAAWLALAEALLVWTGSPPAAWLAGSFTAIYAIGRIVEIARGEEGAAALRRIAPMLVLAIGIAATLVAVVLVPGLTLARHSVQSGRSFESIAEGSLALEDLRALAWPQPGNHLYVGWIALALAPLAWLRRARLPGRWALAIAAAIALGLVLGHHAPFFRVAYEVVPGVRMFRGPVRYEAWIGPALAALAAGGLDALGEKLAGARRREVAALAGVAIALGVAWVALGAWIDGAGLGLAPAALALGAGAVFAGVVTGGREAGPIVGAALALLALLDVSQRLPEHRHTRPRPAPGQDEVAERVLPHAPGTDVAWRYVDEFGISCRSGTRYARRDLRGYQDPLLLHAYERVMASLGEHPELAAQFNARYVLTGPHFIHGWDRQYLPPRDALLARQGARDAGEGVIELRGAVPLAYVVPAAQVERVRTREEALERTIARAPAPIAIVEGEREVAARGAAGVIVEARVIAYESDRIALEIEPPAPGTLIVNDAWYPGWRAWVDRREVAVHRANGLVRAVDVPAGLHDVELRFEPRDGAPLRALLAAGWAALLALLIPWRRQRRVGGDPALPGAARRE